MTKYILTALLSIISILANAQNGVEMADNFRAEGKIYVVVAVVAIIWGGVVFYLFRTEQRISKIEKQLEK